MNLRDVSESVDLISEVIISDIDWRWYNLQGDAFFQLKWKIVKHVC